MKPEHIAILKEAKAKREPSTPAAPETPPDETELERKIAIAKLNHSRWIQVETEAIDLIVRTCREQAEKLRVLAE